MIERASYRPNQIIRTAVWIVIVITPRAGHWIDVGNSACTGLSRAIAFQLKTPGLARRHRAQNLLGGSLINHAPKESEHRNLKPRQTDGQIVLWVFLPGCHWDSRTATILGVTGVDL